MKDKILIACLFYINDSNKRFRISNCLKSLDSLCKIDKTHCDIIAVCNNCSPSFSRRISQEKTFDETIILKKNFWDISVIYTSSFLALSRQYKYCLYTYDDFVFYKYDFVQPCINFLNSNEDTSCIRIPYWNFNKMDNFNSEKTPKSVNPDSVRHYQNTGFDEKNVNCTSSAKLSWDGPIKSMNYNFYKTNWHYVSRPTIWRSEVLHSFFDEQSPVMQRFECRAGEKFHNLNKKTGVLDGGCCHTFKESARSSSQGKNEFVNINQLNKLIK